MNRVDRFIAFCASWEHFWQRTRQLSDAEKGRAFERLVQLYLQTEPEYRTILRQVWLLREVPPDVCKRLDLPSRDEGIDLIACTNHGEYWAIQSKFRSQRYKPLNRRELGTFSSLAFNTCSNIALAVVAHTCSKPVSKRHLMRNTVEIGLDRWQSLDWSLIVGMLKGKSAQPKARTPDPHQHAAVAAAKTHFVRDGAVRGRLIMPCGTGKSLTAYWIAEALKAKTILVAVPSLALVRQSLKDWTREFLAHGIKPDWLCVCSDETVGKLERDEFVGEVYDLGLPTHTDAKQIATLLRAPSTGPKIVFTTYQSSTKLAAAARKARIIARFGGTETTYGWNDLLKRRRVVFLAEAGSGKTTEMMTRAQQQLDAGYPSFYASFEDVGRSGLEAALYGASATWRRTTFSFLLCDTGSTGGESAFGAASAHNKLPTGSSL